MSKCFDNNTFIIVLGKLLRRMGRKKVLLVDKCSTKKRYPCPDGLDWQDHLLLYVGKHG